MDDGLTLADVVVGSALQSLSRSLCRISNRNGPLQDGDAKLLLETAQRTLSLWQLVRRCADLPEAAAGRQNLERLVELCRAHRPMAVQLAERIAAHADAAMGADLGRVVAMLEREALDRDQAGALLQAESVRWRDAVAVRRLDTDELLEQGVVRTFRGARRRYRVLAKKGAGPRRLRRAARWAGHCANHLELLRHALSEEAKARHWHLNHLAAKLEDELGLLRLEELIAASELKSKVRRRLARRVSDERVHVEQQRLKLAAGAFRGGVDAYRAEVVAATHELCRQSFVWSPARDGGARAGRVLEEA